MSWSAAWTRRGRPYFWWTGDRTQAPAEPGTDIAALRENKISVTPVRLDLTDHEFVSDLCALGVVVAEVAEQPTRRPALPLTPAIALAGLAFLAWLWGGYALLLAHVGHLPFPIASWQAVLCLLAVPLLLYVVVKFIALPKPYVNRLHRLLVEALWLLGSLFEVFFPWFGWSLLLWALHRGSWSAAAIPTAVLALFSYLTGFLILALFHPRPRSVRITELDLPCPNLPKPFEGYRLLHLSDLHVSVYNLPSKPRKRIARAADLPADLVAYTGDLTDDAKYLEDAAEMLASVKRSDGLFAVMGNHDNWRGADNITAALEKHAITPLINTHHTVERGGARLHIAGVDNVAYSDRDDLDATFAASPRTNPSSCSAMPPTSSSAPNPAAPRLFSAATPTAARSSCR